MVSEYAPLRCHICCLHNSNQHPKVANDPGDAGDSDIDLDDLSDSDQEEDEYDQLPPLILRSRSSLKNRKMLISTNMSTLLQKKQWKNEQRRLKEMKRRGQSAQKDVVYGEMPDEIRMLLLLLLQSLCLIWYCRQHLTVIIHPIAIDFWNRRRSFSQGRCWIVKVGIMIAGWCQSGAESCLSWTLSDRPNHERQERV